MSKSSRSKKQPQRAVDSRRCVEALLSPQSCNAGKHSNKMCLYNPHCGQSVFGSLKEGIWEEPISHEHWLGPDPANLLRTQMRKCFDRPCGLTNLGATCYLNALVQTIVFNIVIRDCILSIDVQENEQSFDPVEMAIMALQIAIGHMLKSQKCLYSLEAFVDCMQLQKNEQQDPHEFSKLFYSMIEDYFGRSSKKPNMRLRDSITGREASSVSCRQCGRNSVKEVDFQDIELSIDGCRSVEDCINYYYRQEELTGDNRYFCSHCDSRCDALRRTKLVSAPEVLSIQLLRNVYDMTTFQKKKLANEILFSSSIELAQHEYVLVSVLYHKGFSAMGGHYVAEVLNWETNEWWMFDDTVVSKAEDMPQFLFDCANNTKGTGVDLVDKNNSPKPKKKQAGPSLSMKMSNSARKKEVYLLSYVRRDAFEKRLNTADRCSIPKSVEECVEVSDRDFQRELTEYDEEKAKFMQKVNDRKAHVLAIKDKFPILGNDDYYAVPTGWLRQWILGKRDSSLSSKLGEREGCYVCDLSFEGVDDVVAKDAIPSTQSVNSDAIKNTANVDQLIVLSDEACNEGSETEVVGSAESRKPSVAPTELWDFFDVTIQSECHVCIKHDTNPRGINPLDTKLFKFISRDAYELIKELYREENVILKKSSLFCATCELELHENFENASIHASRIGDLLELISSNSPNAWDLENPEGTVRLSREWLSSLKKTSAKLNKDINCLVAALTPSSGFIYDGQFAFGNIGDGSSLIPEGDVNKSLLCSHGLVSGEFRKKSVAISTSVWIRIIESYPQLLSSTRIMDMNDVCGVCRHESEKSFELKRDLQDQRSTEISIRCLQDLFTRKGSFPSMLNFALPSHKTENSRKIRSIQESLNGSRLKFFLIRRSWLEQWRNYIDNINVPSPDPFDSSVFLCDHGLVLIPEQFLTRSAFIEEFDNKLPLEKAPETDDGLPRCELVSEEQWNSLVSCSRIFQSSDDSIINASHGIFLEITLDETAPFWSWSRDCCESCVRAAGQQMMINRSKFENRAIKVVKLRKGETPQSAMLGSSRRSRGRSPVDVYVSSSDTIGLLRMKVFEKIPDAVPILQSLYHGTDEIINNSDTLESLSILAGSTLYLTVCTDDFGDDTDCFMRSAAIMSENEFSMGNGSSAHAAKEGGFNDSIFGRKISKPPTGEESSSGDRKNLVITCDDSDSQHMPPDGHHIGTPAKRTCRRDSELIDAENPVHCDHRHTFSSKKQMFDSLLLLLRDGSLFISREECEVAVNMFFSPDCSLDDILSRYMDAKDRQEKARSGKKRPRNLK